MPATPPPDRLIVRAPAKINLYLHVGGRRGDGFHDLESLVVFADAGDTLSFEPADALSLAVEGAFGGELSNGDDNLVLKAARALAARTGTSRGARIVLRKDLPVASGIGGGSADAAAALRGLCALWSLDIAREKLLVIAAELGSDVPVCLDSQSAFISGRGEKIELAGALPDFRLLLVNPRIAVSTAEVFKNLDNARSNSHPPLEGGSKNPSESENFSGRGKPQNSVGSPTPKFASQISTLPQSAFAKASADKALSPAKPWRSRAQGEGVKLAKFVGYLKTTTNDLELPARAKAPAVGDVLSEISELPGVLLTRMSGSGATCFGIFADEQSSRAARNAILQQHPDWWVTASVPT